MRLFKKITDLYITHKFKDAQSDLYYPYRLEAAINKDKDKLALSDNRINVRILYLKHDSSALHMSDFFAVLLYDILNRVKQELNISEIHIDDKDGASNFQIMRDNYQESLKSPICMDIIDPQCMVVVIVSIWGSDDWRGSSHDHFVNEIRLCKAVKDKEILDFFMGTEVSDDIQRKVCSKNNDMFLPFLLYENGVFNENIRKEAKIRGVSQQIVRDKYYSINDDIWAFVNAQTMKYIHPQIGEWKKMEGDIIKIFRQRIKHIQQSMR